MRTRELFFSHFTGADYGAIYDVHLGELISRDPQRKSKKKLIYVTVSTERTPLPPS